MQTDTDYLRNTSSKADAQIKLGHEMYYVNSTLLSFS